MAHGGSALRTRLAAALLSFAVLLPALHGAASHQTSPQTPASAEVASGSASTHPTTGPCQLCRVVGRDMVATLAGATPEVAPAVTRAHLPAPPSLTRRIAASAAPRAPPSA